MKSCVDGRVAYKQYAAGTHFGRREVYLRVLCAVRLYTQQILGEKVSSVARNFFSTIFLLRLRAAICL